MVKLSIVLLVVALAYTSAKAIDDQVQELAQDASPLSLPGFPDGFPNGVLVKPSADEIERLAPRNPGEHVDGYFQSSSSSFKVVDGQVVEDKQEGKSVSNIDGDVEKSSYSN